MDKAKVVPFPRQPAQAAPQVAGKVFLDLDALVDALDLLHGTDGAPVHAFEDVIEYVDQLRAGAS